MKLSTSTNIMISDRGKPYQIPIDVSVRACADAGYTEVDANLCGFCRPGQPLALDGWEKWAHDTRNLADQLGVSFSQSHAYWTINGSFPVGGVKPDGEWGEELMRRSVIAAQILGTKWMVVHPITVRHQRWYDYKASFAYNREYYERWGEFYSAHGVGMAIENMNSATTYCSCAEELVELIEAIDNPMVEACIDTGHAHMVGIDVPGMIRQVGSHLKATHISDNHQNKDEHFAPFNGTIDWLEVMTALREINYQECFAYEIHNLTGMYPKEVQPALVKFSYELGNYLLNLQAESITSKNSPEN